MNVPFTVTIDLNKPQKNVLHLSQGDTFTRYIELILLRDSVIYDPTADLEDIGAAGTTDAAIQKTVSYLKSNGVGGEYSAIGSTPAVSLIPGTTNRYKVLIDEHATDVPGFCELFVRFSVTDEGGNVHVLHSFPVTLEVCQVLATNTDQSQPYFADFVRKSAQVPKTGLMTSRVGIDAAGALWTDASGGSGGMLMVTEISSGTTDYSYSDIVTAKQGGMLVKFKSSIGIEYEFESLDTNNQRAIFSTTINGGTQIVQNTATISGNAVSYSVLNGYVKPSGGIPSTDMASAVQTSLGKADSAYQKPAGGITIYDLAYDVQTSISKADNAVLVTQQPLSDAQKAQARTNIGAISASDIGTVFTLKGSVAAVADLPSTGNTVGDVYYVEAVSAGYIWLTSTTYPNGYWEELGETIDLSAYEEKPTVVQVSGNTPTIALAQDNTIYELTGTAITSITITARDSGAAFAVIFDTPAGSTPPTFTYPTVNMYMPDDFALDVFRHYEINVDSKGFAAVGSWSYD